MPSETIYFPKDVYAALLRAADQAAATVPEVVLDCVRRQLLPQEVR